MVVFLIQNFVLGMTCALLNSRQIPPRFDLKAVEEQYSCMKTCVLGYLIHARKFNIIDMNALKIFGVFFPFYTSIIKEYMWLLLSE